MQIAVGQAVAMQPAGQLSQRAGQFVAETARFFLPGGAPRCGKPFADDFVERAHVGDFTRDQKTVADDESSSRRAESGGDRCLDAGLGNLGRGPRFAGGRAAAEDVSRKGPPIGDLEMLEKDGPRRQTDPVNDAMRPRFDDRGRTAEYGGLFQRSLLRGGAAPINSRMSVRSPSQAIGSAQSGMLAAAAATR